MGALARSGAALAAIAAAPVVAVALALRPGWRAGARERLGLVPRVAPGAIWVHAASVGEILAASRLFDRLRKSDARVVCSTATRSGRDLMRERRPDVPCHLAPVDHPWCVAAALDRVRPAALVLIETELWPCWIAAASRRHIPVIVVSGRVSNRTYPRYRRLAGLAGRTLRRVSAIGARTPLDHDRFIALGADPARVTVTGDLKLEVEDAARSLAPDLRAALAGVPYFAAGSTRRGEEEAVLAAAAQIERWGLACALVIAPRQMRRVAEVERLARATGRRVLRRSALAGPALGPGDVLVLDSVGELAAVYARAGVAFVGGSLVPHGGHNVVEPVLAGCPVVYGRHTANHRHAVEILENCGAGRAVRDSTELAHALADALRDPQIARERGRAGRRALARHRGSADRAAELIAGWIAGPGAGA